MQPEVQLLRKCILGHPEDAARLVEKISSSEAAAVVSDVEPAAGALVLQKMAPLAALACLREMDRPAAAAVVSQLPVEGAASLLRRLGPQRSRSILQAAPGPSRGPIERLLQYPETTAGALMDPLAQSIPEDLTVEEALAQLRNGAGTLYAEVYVTSRSQSLAGLIGLRDLLQAAARDRVSSLMDRRVQGIYAHTSLRLLENHEAWRQYDSLPVVDRKGSLLGALSHRALRRHQEHAEQEPNRGVDALVALGELYWKGVGAVLESAIAAGLRPRNKTPAP